MPGSYSSRQMIVHWLAALCLAVVIVLAWVMVNAAEGPSTDRLYDWHGSFGIAVFVLTALRIGWRVIDKAPPLPPGVGRWERALAATTFGLFYVVLLCMPVTGYVAAAAGGYSFDFFGLVVIPPLVPRSDALNAAMDRLHHVYGQWVVYALLLLHVAGVAFNVVVRRNGLLSRMLPAQSIADSGSHQIPKP